MERKYHILGLTKKGETKFLSKLLSDWVGINDRAQCEAFTQEQLDYIIPLVESENKKLVKISSFPTHITWME